MSLLSFYITSFRNFTTSNTTIDVYLLNMMMKLLVRQILYKKHCIEKHNDVKYTFLHISFHFIHMDQARSHVILANLIIRTIPLNRCMRVNIIVDGRFLGSQNNTYNIFHQNDASNCEETSGEVTHGRVGLGWDSPNGISPFSGFNSHIAVGESWGNHKRMPGNRLGIPVPNRLGRWGGFGETLP